MDINSIEDIKKVVGVMHDSEFEGNDFFYDESKKVFYLKSHCPIDKNKVYSLEIYNVEKYNPINLDKVNEGKALAGVFNKILIRKNGLELTLLSQDLRIKLNVSSLEGKMEVLSSITQRSSTRRV